MHNLRRKFNQTLHACALATALVGTMASTSAHAMPADGIVRASIELQAIETIPRTITVTQSLGTISMVNNPGTQKISLKLELIGDSPTSLAAFEREWKSDIKVVDNAYVIDVIPRGRMAQEHCTKAESNGAITSVKGVCVGELTVTVPVGLYFALSRDKKTVSFVPPVATFRPESTPDEPASGPHVAPHRFDDLNLLLRGASFDSDRKSLLQEFIEREVKRPGLSITSRDLVRAFVGLGYDSEKLLIVEALAPFVVDPEVGARIVARLLTSEPSKQQARMLLLKTLR